MKKEVQVYILEILQLLKHSIGDGHHNFTLGDDNRLWLWIQIGEKFQSIIFDEDYENDTPIEVVNKIMNALKARGYQFEM